MKVNEFCDFFDFTYEKEHGEIDEDLYSGEYNHIATDNQGVLHNRYVMNISDLSDEFNSLLDDYINEFIEEDGFEYDENAEGTYYEQAYKWCVDTNYEYKTITDVLDCIIHPEKIEEV